MQGNVLVRKITYEMLTFTLQSFLTFTWSGQCFKCLCLELYIHDWWLQCFDQIIEQSFLQSDSAWYRGTRDYSRCWTLRCPRRPNVLLQSGHLLGFPRWIAFTWSLRWCCWEYFFGQCWQLNLSFVWVMMCRLSLEGDGEIFWQYGHFLLFSPPTGTSLSASSSSFLSPSSTSAMSSIFMF